MNRGESVRRTEQEIRARLARQIETRNRLRDEAARLHQQLIIQREAIGLVRHGLVEEQYQIPARHQL